MSILTTLNRLAVLYATIKSVKFALKALRYLRKHGFKALAKQGLNAITGSVKVMPNAVSYP